MLHKSSNIAGMIMTISPDQCRAARGLFAMSRQELANASGVSLRTITSFEDTTDRTPTAANLAAIRTALQRLGVVFNYAGVEWAPPFTETQMRVVRALQVRHGPRMATVADVTAESGCSRGDLEVLAQRQIITGIDGFPLLTAVGLHIPALLRGYEARMLARNVKYAPSNYTVGADDKKIFHARTATVFNINDDGTLTVLLQVGLDEDELEEVTAGAREALRLDRERDPRVKFVWAG
jgi:transcriptional regulator with XRE-family HTH domain